MDEVRTGPFTVSAPALNGVRHGEDTPFNDGGGSSAPPGSSPPQLPFRARRKGPSPKLALIVVGIAAVLVLLFGIGGALDGGTSTAPQPVKVHGAGLASESARAILKPVLLVDTPPSDILTALVIPSGTILTKATKWDGQTQFSATVQLQITQDQAAVVKFYRTELKGRGWDINGTGPADHNANAIQVLATKASNDGWYWEVGVTVTPSTFLNGGTTDTTSYTIELFEVADAT